MYENFIVELDWRHMKEGGNSGVFIWGEGLPAPGVPYARGIEVQVLDLGYETKNPDGAWKCVHLARRHLPHLGRDHDRRWSRWRSPANAASPARSA